MQAINNILLSFKFKKLNLLSNLDNILKNIFLTKTLNHYEKINKPYWIIINDNMLKFHNWDIRKKIKKELVK
jgi:hypothetical protein